MAAKNGFNQLSRNHNQYVTFVVVGQHSPACIVRYLGIGSHLYTQHCVSRFNTPCKSMEGGLWLHVVVFESGWCSGYSPRFAPMGMGFNSRYGLYVQMVSQSILSPLSPRFFGISGFLLPS